MYFSTQQQERDEIASFAVYVRTNSRIGYGCCIGGRERSAAKNCRKAKLAKQDFFPLPMAEGSAAMGQTHTYVLVQGSGQTKGKHDPRINSAM